MSRRLNLLIVALLIAVVPVRGFAATMMAGMGVHGGPVSHAVPPGAAEAVAAADTSPHCPDHAAGADAGPLPDGVGHGHHGDGTGSDHAATCTICSACCTAGALTPPAWRAPVVRATVAPATGPDDLIAGIVLPRLDRPPLAA